MKHFWGWKDVINTYATVNLRFSEGNRDVVNLLGLSPEDYYKLSPITLGSPMCPAVPIPRDLGESGLPNTTLAPPRSVGGQGPGTRWGFLPCISSRTPVMTPHIFKVELLPCGPSGFLLTHWNLLVAHMWPRHMLWATWFLWPLLSSQHHAVFAGNTRCARCNTLLLCPGCCHRPPSPEQGFCAASLLQGKAPRFYLTSGTSKSTVGMTSLMAFGKFKRQ